MGDSSLGFVGTGRQGSGVLFWRSFSRISELTWLAWVRETAMMSVSGRMIPSIFRSRRAETILSSAARTASSKQTVATMMRWDP